MVTAIRYPTVYHGPYSRKKEKPTRSISSRVFSLPWRTPRKNFSTF